MSGAYQAVRGFMARKAAEELQALKQGLAGGTHAQQTSVAGPSGGVFLYGLVGKCRTVPICTRAIDEVYTSRGWGLRGWYSARYDQRSDELQPLLSVSI